MTKWQTKALSKLKMASVGAIFSFIRHTKQLNPWLNSPARHVMIYNQLSACPGNMEPFKDYPSTSGCLTSLGNKPQQKHPGKLAVAEQLPELLVNVYSYCVMVKSVSCCYVHGSWLFSQITCIFNQKDAYQVNTKNLKFTIYS